MPDFMAILRNHGQYMAGDFSVLRKMLMRIPIKAR